MEKFLMFEAKKHYQKQLSNQLSPLSSLTQYLTKPSDWAQEMKEYIYLTMLMLQTPKALLQIIKKGLEIKVIDLSLYLAALNQLSLIWIANRIRCSQLKDLYEYLTTFPPILECISKECLIPESIAQAMPYLRGKGPSLRAQPKIKQTYLESNYLYQFNQQAYGYSKLLLYAQNTFKTDGSRLQWQNDWNKCLQIIGQYDLRISKVFDTLPTHFIRTESYSICQFILSSIKKYMGVQKMIQICLSKIGYLFQQKGETIVYQLKLIDQFLLNELQLQVRSNPLWDTFQLLCLMYHYGLITIQSFFPLLSPSITFIDKLTTKRIELYKYFVDKSSKRSLQLSQTVKFDQFIWGDIKNSSKLQLMNQMLLMNRFSSFKKILLNYGIKIDLLYHTRILYTLSLMLQWIIDPIYQMIGYSRFFKGDFNRYSIVFPQGDFKQCSCVNNSLIQSLSSILEIGKSYVFARKISFIKICRLFQAICSKQSKIPREQTKFKIVGVIVFIVKRYLLPSLEYYEIDPSLSFQLDRLINCFIFKYQLQLYLEYLKQMQLSNLHLTAISEQITNEAVWCFNRVSKNADKDEVVLKKLGKLLVNHPFSIMKEMFRTLSLSWQGFSIKIISIMQYTPMLNKKISLFFVLQSLMQPDQNISGMSEVEKSERSRKCINILSQFVTNLIINEKNNSQFIKIIIEYVMIKLYQVQGNSLGKKRLLKLFRQIDFIKRIIFTSFPDQMDEMSINNYNRISLVSGPLLKIRLMEKTQDYFNHFCFRQNLVHILFTTEDKNNVFSTKFYSILLNLVFLSQKALSNNQLSINEISNIQQSILKLIMNLINISEDVLTPQEAERYFSLEVFISLLEKYNVPLQISFCILRKGVRIMMQNSDFNWVIQRYWASFKSNTISAIKNYNNKNSEYFKQKCNIQDSINLMIQSDIYLTFWIQQPQYALYVSSLYDTYSKDNNDQSHQSQSSIRIIQNRNDQYSDLLRQQSNVNKFLHSKLKKSENQGKNNFQQDYNRKFLIKNKEQFINDQQYYQYCIKWAQMIIKYCILPRALMSKSDAYFSSCFFWHFIKRNKLTLAIIYKLISIFQEKIVEQISFSTDVEVRDNLTLLYASSNIFSTNWWNFKKFCQRAHSQLHIIRNINYEQYSQILLILYESQLRIIENLMNFDNQSSYIVKNKLYFLFKSKDIPFCSDQISFTANSLKKLQENNRDDDVLKMLGLLQNEMITRYTSIKMIPKNIKNQYLALETSLRMENSKNFKSEESFDDPLEDYPNISMSIDLNLSTAPEQPSFSYTKSRWHKNLPQKIRNQPESTPPVIVIEQEDEQREFFPTPFKKTLIHQRKSKSSLKSQKSHKS